MKYLINSVLTILTLSLSINVKAEEKYIFLNDLKWPPYFFPNVEKGQMGFGKEVLISCINQLEYKITFKFLPIKRTHIYMKSGELDVSIYSHMDERKEFVFYGKEPLFVTQYGLASKKSDNLTIEALSDINQYTFGHLDGLAHTKELREIIKLKLAKNEVSKGYDIDAMFGQLLATPQRFQVMASSKETLKWRAKQLDIADQIKVHDFTIKEKAYFVTVSKFSQNIKDPIKFLTHMDTCIKNTKETHQYSAIAQQYGL